MNEEYMPLLAANKLQAVCWLVEGRTKTAIAKELGIERKTLWDWEQTEDFRRALEIQQRRVNEQITDPSPYLAGMVVWKARLPEMMERLMETACNADSPRQARAAELILNAVTPDKLNIGKTDDQKIIAKWLEQNGIAPHPTMEKGAS